MASLPSIASSGTLKLDPEVRKFPTFEKNANVGYTKSITSTSPPQLEAKSERKKFPDLEEALSIIKQGSTTATTTDRVQTSFYVPLLEQCVTNNSVSSTKVLHTHIIKTGTQNNIYIATFLVNVYAKCGHIDDAQKLFDQLPRRNVVTWTSLMTGYVQNSRPKEAVDIFLQMLEFGAYPSSYTFGTVLRACSSLFFVKLGKQIHAYIVKYGVESDTSIGNSLCSFYSKCGSLDSAVKSFERVNDKNVISWTTIIAACGDSGYTTKGLRFFMEMFRRGDVELNEFTFTTILSLLCSIQGLELGRQVHSVSIKLGHQQNLQIKNSMMYLYLKCGVIDEARKLFNGMETISLITWNAIIAGYAQVMDMAKDDILIHNCGNEALNTFKQMYRSGLKPDLFTFSSILSVCSSLAALPQGEQIHAQTLKSGFLADVVVGTALLNMYSKCGNIQRASKAFTEMPTRTLICWTSMITALANHGFSQQALKLFEELRSTRGLKPNKITFVGVLAACSQAGMVDEAYRYFEMMRTEYRIQPVMEHYSCLIGLFVRLGRIDEAFDVIKKMEFEPNELIWSILIAGCRHQGKTELEFHAAEKLLELKPNDAETYVMLMNMYMSAGRWQDVTRVRKLMKEEKVGKFRDWSWISVKDKVYSFRTNHTDPDSTSIESYVGKLVEQAKSMGYRPKNIEVGDDEEGEKGRSSSTQHHSEKLAVGFGLLNTQGAVPIRVVKSSIMCRDCHGFVKMLSKMTDREIVIRDSKRLHKFVNGECSCGDLASLL